MDGHQALALRQAPTESRLQAVSPSQPPLSRDAADRHTSESATSGPRLFRAAEPARPRPQANRATRDPLLDQRTGTAMTVKSASNRKPSSSSSKCAVQVIAGPEPGGPLPQAFA